MVIILYIYKGLTTRMLHTKRQGNMPNGSGKEDFQGFCRTCILAWMPSWSCDLEQMCKLSLSLTNLCRHKVTVTVFWRRRFFKGFYIYGHVRHAGHVIWTKIYKLSFPLCQEAAYEL